MCVCVCVCACLSVCLRYGTHDLNRISTAFYRLCSQKSRIPRPIGVALRSPDQSTDNASFIRTDTSKHRRIPRRSGGVRARTHARKPQNVSTNKSENEPKIPGREQVIIGESQSETLTFVITIRVADGKSECCHRTESLVE